MNWGKLMPFHSGGYWRQQQKKKSFWGAVIQILILSALSLLLWAFPLFSLFLLHAARGLCSQPRELTVVIMVLTMKDLKLLLGFFSFNESEKSGVEGDKRKEKERDEGTEKGFMFTENLSKKIRHWKSGHLMKKKKTNHIFHSLYGGFKNSQTKYTKLGSFTCSITDKCISIMTKEMTLRNLRSFKLNRKRHFKTIMKGGNPNWWMNPNWQADIDNAVNLACKKANWKAGLVDTEHTRKYHGHEI